MRGVGVQLPLAPRLGEALDRPRRLASATARAAPDRDPWPGLPARPGGAGRLGARGPPRQPLGKARACLRADRSDVPRKEQARALRAQQPPRLDRLGQRSPNRTRAETAMNSSELSLLLDRLVEQVAERVAQRLLTADDHSDDSQSPWMNIDSAATYLDLPKQRLYKLCAQGAIPHYKQEGRLLFHRGELDQWLAQFRQPDDWIFSG